MQDNKTTIEQFYQAFANKDAAAMRACYSEDIAFSDPAFGLLQGDEVGDMWEMLLSRATDLVVEAQEPITDDDEYYTVEWMAHYTFSATGNKVHNKVKSYLRMRNGIIIEHSDAFHFHKWCSMALGWKGWWFGWTGYMQKKVQNQSRKLLMKYREKKYQDGRIG